MTHKLLQGDVLDKLAEIKTGTVQTCVTSPPYWGLRDYGVPGQLGLEPTPEEYVNKMVEVFREVKRVLRDDGTLWLNLGDSYNNTSGFSRASPEYFREGRVGGSADKKTFKHSVIKTKDLCGIPWMVAFALRADGWYLRSDIIWAKPNPMPESVTDRPTKAHEYIFLLSKRKRYFYDAEAVREPGAIPAGTKAAKGSAERFNTPGVNSRPPEYKIYNGTRNRRSVWTIPTQPYPEAHFATFPPKLIEPCILAGTSPKACEICGAPWKRVVERDGMTSREWQKIRGDGTKGFDKKMGKQGKSIAGGRPPDPVYKTVGWQPTCTCQNEGKGRCIVLDPFVGSGTTLWVAERFGRDSIGIEINPKYCELVKKRMSNFQQTIFKGVTL
jgi:DNA modification methylase